MPKHLNASSLFSCPLIGIIKKPGQSYGGGDCSCCAALFPQTPQQMGNARFFMQKQRTAFPSLLRKLSSLLRAAFIKDRGRPDGSSRAVSICWTFDFAAHSSLCSINEAGGSIRRRRGRPANSKDSAFSNHQAGADRGSFPRKPHKFAAQNLRR